MAALAPAPGRAETAAASPVAAPKRITVLETNNFRLRRGYLGLPLPKSLSSRDVVALREHVRPWIPPKIDDEMDSLMLFTAKVHAAFRHDSFGDATPDMSALDILRAGAEGKRFSCTEYSLVLSDVLIAHGFPARSVIVQTPQVAYGSIASGHVLTEVWSNQFNKWILLDAQFGIYAERDHIALNVYELYEAMAAGEWSAIRFRSASPPGSSDGEEQIDAFYRAFIAQYLGYVASDLLAEAEKVPVLLRLQGTDWPLTAQGRPKKAHIFAREPEAMYFELNHVSLTMEFRAESQPPGFDQLSFSSVQEYEQRIASLAAVPDFEVTPRHNMPWFDRFQFAIDDGPWRDLSERTFRWNLHEGENRLRVRAVNAAGRFGPVTMMRVRYGT